MKINAAGSWMKRGANAPTVADRRVMGPCHFPNPIVGPYQVIVRFSHERPREAEKELRESAKVFVVNRADGSLGFSYNQRDMADLFQVQASMTPGVVSAEVQERQ